MSGARKGGRALRQSGATIGGLRGVRKWAGAACGTRGAAASSWRQRRVGAGATLGKAQPAAAQSVAQLESSQQSAAVMPSSARVAADASACIAP